MVRNKCPTCQAEIGGRPLDTLVKDIALQNIADWVIPDFKERDERLKAQLLLEAQHKRK